MSPPVRAGEPGGSNGASGARRRTFSGHLAGGANSCSQRCPASGAVTGQATAFGRAISVSAGDHGRAAFEDIASPSCPVELLVPRRRQTRPRDSPMQQPICADTGGAYPCASGSISPALSPRRGRSVHRMDLRATMERLVAAASLPAVVGTEPMHGLGMDNQLLLGALADGRQVLLRQGEPAPSPEPRARFFDVHGIGAPRLWAADDNGAVLVDFVPGETLVAVAQRGALDDDIWRRVGRGHARVHAVHFPAPLCGPVGPETLELVPEDPVDSLREAIDTAEPWIQTQRPALMPYLDEIRARIDSHADELRSEVPCLTHLDTNFLNVIVGDTDVTLIDWDFPMVRYPLEELAGLEEHAYLYGVPELPDAFFEGYGRNVSRPLLRLYRIISCLQTLSSPDWARMISGQEAMPADQLAMVRRFYTGWSKWFDDLGNHLATA